METVPMGLLCRAKDLSALYTKDEPTVEETYDIGGYPTVLVYPGDMFLTLSSGSFLYDGGLRGHGGIIFYVQILFRETVCYFFQNRSLFESPKFYENFEVISK